MPPRRIRACEPCDELGEVERLGQIVITACRKPAQAIGNCITRGQEHDRRAEALGSNGLTQVASVGVGEADIDHEDIGVDVWKALEQLGRLDDPFRSKARFAEAAKDQ